MILVLDLSECCVGHLFHRQTVRQHAAVTPYTHVGLRSAPHVLALAQHLQNPLKKQTNRK